MFTGSKLPQKLYKFSKHGPIAPITARFLEVFLKDKIWFSARSIAFDQRGRGRRFIRPWAAPGSPRRRTTVAGPPIIAKEPVRGKGTFSISQNHTYCAVFGDPTAGTGAIFTTANGQQFVLKRTCPAPGKGTRSSRASVDSVRVSLRKVVFKQYAMLVSVMGGQHREKKYLSRRRRQARRNHRPGFARSDVRWFHRLRQKDFKRQRGHG